MCGPCLARTQRHYRAGEWFFYALAALFAVGAPFIVGIDYRRFGLRTALIDSGLLVGLTALTGGGGYLIRHFGAKVR